MGTVQGTTRVPVAFYSIRGHVHRLAESVAGGRGERQSSGSKLAGARYPGSHVAQIAREPRG